VKRLDEQRYGDLYLIDSGGYQFILANLPLSRSLQNALSEIRFVVGVEYCGGTLVMTSSSAFRMTSTSSGHRAFGWSFAKHGRSQGSSDPMRLTR
jgi:hypothetical protein